MEITRLQAELRSVLQGPKTDRAWWQLMELLAPYYPLLRDAAQAPEVDPATLEQLEDEVMSWLEQELDRSWPARLRLAVIVSHPRLKRLAKVLYINWLDHLIEEFAALQGVALRDGARSPRVLKELLPLMVGQGGYEGFVLGRVERQLGPLVEALLEANGAPIKHLRLSQVRLNRGEEREIASMMERLISSSGATLESFAASFEGLTFGRDLEQLYQPLIRRAHELPALRALGLPDAPYDGDDVLKPALEVFDGLEELTLRGAINLERAVTLMGHSGALKLRRFGAGDVERFGVEPAQLVCASRLKNVEAWDLRRASRDDDSWETAEVASWREVQQGTSAARDEARLEREVVDLSELDQDRARDALFDGDVLRASTRLEALRVRKLGVEDIARLIRQAPEAWPNLKCLVFMCFIDSPMLQELWASSPLLDTLRFLDWPDRLDPVNRDIRRRAEALRDDAEALRGFFLGELELALDAAQQPFFAYRRWSALRQAFKPWPEVRLAVARRLGVAEPLPESWIAQEGACEARFKALRVDGARMLIDGPRYATTLKDQFEWPPRAEEGQG